MEEQAQASMLLLGQARQQYSEGKYQEALDNYRRSLTALPKSPNMEKRRRFLETSIADASVAVAQEYIKAGRYDEAVKLLEDALKSTPDHALARRTLEIARDPVRTNPALSPEHVKNVEEVSRLLHLAFGYYELGQYDAALKGLRPSLRRTLTIRRRGAAWNWLTAPEPPILALPGMKPAAVPWRMFPDSGRCPFL
ncbi:MAG: tetratricopeptide repeat protein [Akkermansia sp.]